MPFPVSSLLQRGNFYNHNPWLISVVIDRWGNTALTDAERFERQDVVEYLREAVKISNSNSKGTPSTSDQTPAPELTEPKPTEPPTDQVKPKQEQGQQEV